MALGWELLPSEEKVPPTAQQSQALTHVLPMRMSLCVGPVLGLVMMVQPEPLAARAVGTAEVRTNNPAMMAPRHRATRLVRLLPKISRISIYRHKACHLETSRRVLGLRIRPAQLSAADHWPGPG